MKILLALCLSLAAFAHEGEEGAAAVGQGKGILAYDEQKGMKLGPEAEKTFGLKYAALGTGAPWTLPAEALVASRDKIYVYREREGFLGAALVEVVSRNGAKVIVRSASLRAGDRLVVKGAAAVRVADLDLARGGT